MIMKCSVQRVKVSDRMLFHVRVDDDHDHDERGRKMPTMPINYTYRGYLLSCILDHFEVWPSGER